jgi:putative FmdB family regulatory protein
VPTYEYECGICCHLFERKQSFDEEPVAMCPKCEGEARRVLRSVPVIFKGSGFYVTDSRQGSDAGKTEKKAPDKGVKKESSGGESATAASH